MNAVRFSRVLPLLFVLAACSEEEVAPTYQAVAVATRDISVTAQAAEFMVNVRTLDNQFRPDVAASAAGDFVITWQSNQQEAPGSSYGVFARRFNSVGTAQGNEFQVNTYTVGP